MLLAIILLVGSNLCFVHLVNQPDDVLPKRAKHESESQKRRQSRQKCPESEGKVVQKAHLDRHRSAPFGFAATVHFQKLFGASVADL